MERIVYNTLGNYFHALELKGYMPQKDAEKALVLSFYWDYIYQQSCRILKRSEYMQIEKALDCLYGSSCLIPYPDYLKMGKLHLGEIAELAQRVQAIEDTNVLKAVHNPEELETGSESDIIFVEAEEDESVD